MGKEIVYCEICGERILEQDFGQGRAFSYEGKHYCKSCREEAVSTLGINDALLEEPVPPEKSHGTPSRLPAVRPSTPASQSTRRVAMAGGGRATAPRRSRGNAGLILAIAGGAVVVAIILAIALGGGGETPRKDKPPEPPKSTSGPDPAKTEREEKAAAAIRKLKAMEEIGTDPQKILDECSRAAATVAGTACEPQLQAIEKTAKELAQKVYGEFDRILAEVAALPSKDARFERYGEAVKLLEKAETFVRGAPDREQLLKTARDGYLQKYNEAACKDFETINREAEGLARQMRYEEAIKTIERYPAQFKSSSYWPGLEAALNRYRSNAARNAPPPPPPPPSTQGPSPSPDSSGLAPDNWPSKTPPKAGEWATILDPRNTDNWSRLQMQGEKGDNWKVEGDALVGRSSREAPALARQAVTGDYIILLYADITDFEFECKMKVEGISALAGGRLRIKDGKTIGGYATAPAGDWATFKLKIEGRTVKATRDKQDIPTCAQDMPDAGRVFLGLSSGAKVWVKDVKFRRLK